MGTPALINRLRLPFSPLQPQSDGIGETRRDEFHSGSCEGRILGDDHFTEEALAKTDQPRVADYSLDDVLGVVCRRYGITLEQLKAPGKARPYSEARAFAALLVREAPKLCLTELGRILNRNIAPLGRAGQRMLEKAAEDAGVNAQVVTFRLELDK